MELLLIRHAQTQSNVVRALDTAHPGADLTELGQKQARELGELLAGEVIDAVYTSPRLRTRRTAVPLAAPRGLTPIQEEGLVEVSAGDWEMTTEEHLAEAYNGIVSDWVRGDFDAGVPGGETGHEVLARVDGVVERIVSAGHERVAIISHGALLRGWCGVRAAGASELAVTHPLRNTGLVRLTSGACRLHDLVVTQWDEQAVPSGGEAGAAVEL